MAGRIFGDENNGAKKVEAKMAGKRHLHHDE